MEHADLLVKFVEKHGKIYLKFEQLTNNDLIKDIIERLDITYKNICNFSGIQTLKKWSTKQNS